MIALFDIDFSGLINGLLGGIGDAFKSLFSWLWSQVQVFIAWVWSLLPHQLPWPSGAPTPGDGINYILDNTTVIHALAAANYYSPVNIILVLLCAIVGQEIGLRLWWGLRWLLTKLPFVGGAA